MLLPIPRLKGQTYRIEFRLRDDEPQTSQLMRKTIVMIWMMDFFIFTTAGELLDLEDKIKAPEDKIKAPNDKITSAKAQFNWHVDVLGRKRQGGPFLVQNQHDSKTRLRRIECLFVVGSEECQQWMMAHRIQLEPGRPLEEAMHKRLEEEVAQGMPHVEEWGRYYDLFLPGQ